MPNWIVGAVVSMLMRSMVAVTVLPARSVKVAVAVWFCPSLTMFRSTKVAPSIPESVSVAVKRTVTAVLFQPLAFAAVRVNETNGSVLSILIVTEPDPVNPALLIAVHVSVVPAVSVLSVVVEHPVEEAMLDSGSVMLHVTVTSLRYQLLLPKVPVSMGVITGAVLSDGGGGDANAKLCALPAAIPLAPSTIDGTGVLRFWSEPSPSWPFA